MTKNLDAIYENGAFHPVGDSPIALSDGDYVRLTIEPISDDAGSGILELAASVYKGFSEEDVAEVERIATDRTSFFSH